MVLDYSKLKGKIYEVYGNITNLAVDIGMSKTMLSKKLNNKSAFSVSLILILCTKLQIPKEEIGTYFFNQPLLKVNNKN